jgi:beta-mannosidase
MGCKLLRPWLLVHWILMSWCSRLEDPYVGYNELKAGWVGTRSWTYRTQFQTPPISHQSKAELVFDGLDTFAEVRLDGKLILTSSNMFISHRVNIKEALKCPGQHDLEISFDSALLRAREIQKKHLRHKWACFNGEGARLAVRKAQYHWGWDWGPLLSCAGIWKPIRLEIYSARIDDLRASVSLASDLKSATVGVGLSIAPHHCDDLEAKITISLHGTTISESSCTVPSDRFAFYKFVIDSPSLWMPAGYGSQKLYDVQVRLVAQKVETHSKSCRIGLRNVELVQEPDSHGKSFYFRINGVDIFCGGSCWIPTDCFLTNITPGRYRAWIELMVQANQKMIRCVSPLLTTLHS